jgi:hypothetical protein
MKSINQRFKEAYEGLPRRDSLKVQRELIEQAGWSRSLFYMRLKGTRKLKADEVPMLVTVFKKYGIDILSLAESYN